MADGASGLGLELQIVRAAGSEVVRVAPRSAAAAAGLRAGDLITAMDDRQAPAPARIADAFRAAPAGTRIMLMVERGAIHVALVLRKP
jgi:S1-C subfamily serine protease